VSWALTPSGVRQPLSLAVDKPWLGEKFVQGNMACLSLHLQPEYEAVRRVALLPASRRPWSPGTGASPLLPPCPRGGSCPWCLCPSLTCKHCTQTSDVRCILAGPTLTSVSDIGHGGLRAQSWPKTNSTSGGWWQLGNCQSRELGEHRAMKFMSASRVNRPSAET
jgi:hypothetical protein